MLLARRRSSIPPLLDATSLSSLVSTSMWAATSVVSANWKSVRLPTTRGIYKEKNQVKLINNFQIILAVPESRSFIGPRC